MLFLRFFTSGCQAHWGLVLEALKEKRRPDDDGSDEDALKIVLGQGKW